MSSTREQSCTMGKFLKENRYDINHPVDLYVRDKPKRVKGIFLNLGIFQQNIQIQHFLQMKLLKI